MRQLTNSDAKIAASLLRTLLVHLKSSMESVVVPGTGEPDPRDAGETAGWHEDRDAMRAAERLIKKLEAKRAL